MMMKGRSHGRAYDRGYGRGLWLTVIETMETVAAQRNSWRCDHWWL